MEGAGYKLALSSLVDAAADGGKRRLVVVQPSLPCWDHTRKLHNHFAFPTRFHYYGCIGEGLPER